MKTLIAAAIALWTPLALAQIDPHAEHRPAAAAATELSPAKAFFEKIKSLDGKWEGKSTKGWTDQTGFRTIAGGSVVMETSFDAHPGETMITMYHMDGPDLMLTHYCVARNQPRLKATKFSQDGSTATFTFLDATNLASRDRGHMDQCIVTIDGPDHFSSRWTWYQEGKEQWMEDIEHRRAAAASPGVFAPAQPEAAKPVAASVESLSFLAGAWVGEVDGDHVEEHWTGPKHGTIQGMFRWVHPDGEVALLELLAIAKEKDGVVMRLRHFDGELTPWKSEVTPTVVTLAECSAGKAVFKGEPGKALAGIVYERAGDELNITVSFSDDREALNFSLKRK